MLLSQCLQYMAKILRRSFFINQGSQNISQFFGGTLFSFQIFTSKPILQFFLNPCKYQGQPQSLLVMRIPKQSLILKLTKILMKLYLY